MTIKPEVVDDWNIFAQEYLKRTVWSDGCRSWYKNGKIDGPITALYPGSMFHFKDFLGKVRGEDFDIKYRSGNRFRFLGDGFTKREKEDADMAWYLEA